MDERIKFVARLLDGKSMSRLFSRQQRFLLSLNMVCYIQAYSDILEFEELYSKVSYAQRRAGRTIAGTDKLTEVRRQLSNE